MRSKILPFRPQAQQEGRCAPVMLWRRTPHAHLGLPHHCPNGFAEDAHGCAIFVFHDCAIFASLDYETVVFHGCGIDDGRGCETAIGGYDADCDCATAIGGYDADCDCANDDRGDRETWNVSVGLCHPSPNGDASDDPETAWPLLCLLRKG